MSGLAGIFRSDGTPVDRADLAAMTGALAHRGPDGVGTFVDGPVALAHLELRTTTVPSAAQPVVDRDGQVCLALDGRIDNRSELRADLGDDRGRLRDGSDAELLLVAYLRWGRRCIGRVVGELALALWDGRTRELVLARDFLGKRPLVYHRGAHAVRWGSELRAVLADPSISRRPNVGMIGERLSLRTRSTTDTVFEGIQRVPPAHLLVISGDGVHVERHWDWDRAPVVRRSDDDHVAELREALDTSVLACLDAPGPVGAELSGGVDSSSVVATAAHLVRDGQAAVALELFSLVFPGEAYDESTYIRSVASHLGMPTTELRPTPAGADHYLRQIDATLEPPEPPNLAMSRDLHRLARERGARALLTGSGGDEWFAGSPLVLADALRQLRPVRAWRAARLGRRVWVARGPFHQLVRDGIRPLLPERLQRHVERQPLPAWLPGRFWAGIGLAERTRAPRVEGPNLARAFVASALEDGSRLFAAEVAEKVRAAAGLEGRAPLDDRRVVELALRLPEDVRRRGLAGKWALRVAMEGRLPEEVRRRPGKANMIGVFYDELAAQGGGALFRDLALADLGWVDGTVVRGMWDELEAAHGAGSGNPHAWPLWMILSTDRWVRAIF